MNFATLFSQSIRMNRDFQTRHSRNLTTTSYSPRCWARDLLSQRKNCLIRDLFFRTSKGTCRKRATCINGKYQKYKDDLISCEGLILSSEVPVALTKMSACRIKSTEKCCQLHCPRLSLILAKTAFFKTKLEQLLCKMKSEKRAVKMNLNCKACFQ